MEKDSITPGDKVSAIILAGGSGKRMQSEIPKQYMRLGEHPILYYSLKAFDNSSIDEITLVINENDREYLIEKLLKTYTFQKPVHLAPGGEERYLSVYNGLQVCRNSDYVLVHDGARPFISVEIIEETIKNTKEYKACAVGVPVKDTIKIIDTNGTIKETPDRSKVWAIQTPQAFQTSLIINAYEQLLADLNQETGGGPLAVTDDAMVLECTSRYPIKIIMGSYSNIKITTPEDIRVGEALLKGLKEEFL
ncbi:2-C-methyl-D-erythritol 4-phosphate cytidylyltransferase [Anaerocolumna sp. AGMB13020]|uniref:2-C-methyl-D-erythritol 4-phosphate cytidylyltransferase n=1 Tax=Anaerocolumna sp. AGMB13020 TaxID=3081750 RepID=UPI002954156B|nr:2-C-methyl-D-erythritol 4-phosphate cytidylyltransferase [Anaerocolumna sp. AGMB13020]WOO38820.1 2-C-methyl-D-erythritol 4-phosphate cytidylyltransferase [Anaerocolumna sp. AGMB13020]